MFGDLLRMLTKVAKQRDFIQASMELASFVDKQSTKNFLDMLQQIGTIPESIHHDSSEEKLFSKASDAILSRAFRDIGLKSTIIPERADSGDVIAKSQIFEYSIVADAKAFRMSRTAKNQKDFKVTALSSWRKDSEYAVLCSPYFQYPSKNSQIYAQALLENVCLVSWEHFIFMIQNGIKESEEIDLSTLWNFSRDYSSTCSVANRKVCFTNHFDEKLLVTVNLNSKMFSDYLDGQVTMLQRRGRMEKEFWVDEISKIKQYTRAQAIQELIRAKKIDGKIKQIDSFLKGLKSC